MKVLSILMVAIFIAHSYAQSCPPGEVLCAGTVDECIKEEYVCDGTFIDCSNDADEIGCPCDRGYFSCPNSTLCIPDYWVCDYEADCPGGEDEVDCPPCPGFTCENGECIPDYWVCDGYGDCAGGEDERQDCPPCDGFECSDGDCIPERWVCDGDNDCSNDEENCSVQKHPLISSHVVSGELNMAKTQVSKLAKRKERKARKVSRSQSTCSRKSKGRQTRLF